MIILKRTLYNDPDFVYLIDLLDKDLWIRYPDTQQDFVPFNNINLDFRVIVAYEEGIAVGCGCYKETKNDNVVEMKRIYVKENARGKGIAKAVLSELEQWAIEEGNQSSILETGINQPESISLYKKIGYTVIDKYEPYVNSEESVCMGKDL
ncbi:GNAT family N-acetyltransferase [Paenibacillus endoradicis]|uniref:GNAT family N-acetyltransferase n=1 Tax=Paenibacillus endoradicis TaxID=2972487 RepID=UPI002159556A|nr:GNAT family N-acetyltransferase [Paenibacillus endoradicis]MCR8656634.1 GNAT family N-acetyltransferase [Paenibacillus endoradicis]